MGKKVHVDIAISSCFMTRRYEKPESWAKIISDLGFEYVSLDSDALDYFYSGDPDYIEKAAKHTRKVFEDSGLKIIDYLTGFAPYRFFGLAHEDAESRMQMYRWLEGAIKIASLVGAESVSGRFDAFSVEVLNDPAAYKERYDELLRLYRGLAVTAKKEGLLALGIEQMYVPSLIPYTISGTKEYFADANLGNTDGVTLRPVLDTGHACGQDFGVAEEDLYYEKWIEEFGALCNTIHIQQTRRTGSDHAAFTPDTVGDVTIEGIVSALEHSVKNYNKNCLAKDVPLPENIYLILEVIPSTSQSEQQIFDELKQSYEYLRTVVPEGGIDISAN